MAHTHASFLADFDSTWPAIINGNPQSPYRNAPFQAARDGWDLYQIARNNAGNGPLKIGLFPHLTRLLGAPGAGLGSVFDNPPGRLFIERPNQRGRWQLYFNDCYILGGIHAHATFELQNFDMPVNDPELIPAHHRDPGFEQLDYVGPTAPAWRLKVTQREVIGLNTFGYAEQVTANNIRTLHCT